MSRHRSAAVRDDGRLRLRVDLPPEVVELADHLADQAGLDREAVLGDLASVGLPAVLADLATAAVAAPATRRLRSVVPPDAERPGQFPTTRVVPHTMTDATSVEPESTGVDCSADGISPEARRAGS